MANKNTNTLSLPYGVSLTFEDGMGLIDYAQMRANQLDALASILVSDDFRTYSDSVQTDVMWLLSTLATETKEMLPLIYDRWIKSERQIATTTY